MNEGKKNDQDLYDKVDYSLVPIDLIIQHIQYKINNEDPDVYDRTKEMSLFIRIHSILNGEAPAGSISVVFKDVINYYGVKPLAVVLGIGVVKYERDNWRNFDSDPNRFLRAALRHLMAIIMGNDYDGEEIPGYDKGTDHSGAVCFNLMVADNILNKGE